MQPGFSMAPFVTYSQQSAPGGLWNFPPAGETDFVLLSGGVVYLNITASDCQIANPVPNGRVLRTHHYYSKRPYATYMYGEFDSLKWSAYIGMGNETVGTALAGRHSIQLPLPGLQQIICSEKMNQCSIQEDSKCCPCGCSYFLLSIPCF